MDIISIMLIMISSSVIISIMCIIIIIVIIWPQWTEHEHSSAPTRCKWVPSLMGTQSYMETYIAAIACYMPKTTTSPGIIFEHGKRPLWRLNQFKSALQLVSNTKFQDSSLGPVARERPHKTMTHISIL